MYHYGELDGDCVGNAPQSFVVGDRADLSLHLIHCHGHYLFHKHRARNAQTVILIGLEAYMNGKSFLRLLRRDGNDVQRCAVRIVQII